LCAQCGDRRKAEDLSALAGFEPSPMELSADRETLFFSSSRTGSLGGLDLYMSTRSKEHRGNGQG
jgi:hypothetical protein